MAFAVKAQYLFLPSLALVWERFLSTPLLLWNPIMRSAFSFPSVNVFFSQVPGDVMDGMPMSHDEFVAVTHVARL
ncbi:hypothetical protein BC567DRAFT_220894 [Phyllosticta citribraziliensis]